MAAMQMNVDQDDLISQEKLEELVRKSDALEKQFQENLDAMAKAVKGMCVECTDQPAILLCVDCNDEYCEICFGAQHRRGKRTKHVTKPIVHSHVTIDDSQTNQHVTMDSNAELVDHDSAQSIVSAASDSTSDEHEEQHDHINHDNMNKMDHTSTTTSITTSTTSAASASSASSSALSSLTNAAVSAASNLASAMGNIFYSPQPAPLSTVSTSLAEDQAYKLELLADRAKYSPLRLSLEDRKYMRLLDAALSVSEYTDKVDIYSYQQKSKRIMTQLNDICAILSGLVLAADYKAGQRLLKGKEFKEFEPFLQDVFELGRRHKIRNPEKMRNSYGKLMYLLQDSQMPEIMEQFEINLVRNVRNVYEELEKGNALDMLKEPALLTATTCITAEGKTRPVIDREIKTKERAIEILARKYTSPSFSYDDARNCILSIGDHHSFLLFNRDPVIKMLEYLQKYFRPDQPEANFNLAIMAGRGGARLSHSHGTQYAYVFQSLTLWKVILDNFYKLWFMSEGDLLDPNNRYRLTDTGQGLQRLQGCPRVGRVMSSILSKAQRECDSWVGSSVVHLGDSNVPNSFMFIDKYTQVSRILQPIVICMRKLDEMYGSPSRPDVTRYVNDNFGDLDTCKKTILCDFFRHGFDGSGANDFFSAGSCIDGRLTSAWEWCSKIDKKPYYGIFLLTGFVSFDGDWS